MNRYSEFPDEELLQLLKDDDHQAFNELYSRHWSGLYNTAYKRLRDTDACKDIVQDVFTDLWIRNKSTEIKNIAAYLHTAVRFQVFKLAAREKTIPAFFELFESIAVSSVEADENIIEKELVVLIEAWIAALPEKRRNIFLLHYKQELSTKEIAEQLNISQKTVQNQLGTSFHDLRSRLAQFLTLMLSLILILSFLM